MRACWQMWRGHFQPDTCNRFVTQSLALPVQEAVVGHGGKMRADAKLRVSKVRWITRTGAPNKKGQWTSFLDRVTEMFHEANNNAFGFEIRNLPAVQFTEYDGAKNGFYDWHEDLDWKMPTEYHRKLSLVIQLSDPSTYTGGDLQLKEDQPNPEWLREQGTAIIFPSFLRHRVTPVTRGTRYSLVGWMEGPKFR